MKDNETIAQFLKITKFPFEINDDDGNRTYWEDSDGHWEKREFDSNGEKTYKTYYENSKGYWWKREFDSDGNQTYYEDSTGFWWKREYDSEGKITFFENSDGHISDYRPKTTTVSWEEISEKFGIDPDKLKIEKKGF